MTRGRIGLLGGTFDPIHSGHLDAAEAAQRALHLDEIWLIPSHDPPHRHVDPLASAFHRFALVALAIQDRPAYRASDIEIARPGASYTIDTLRALHAQGWSASQLYFIIGADAFADIATWHEYPAVLGAAHFVVIARPGTTLAEACARTPELAERARDLSHEARASSPESRAPNPQSRIPNPESRVPNPESRTPSPESRVPTDTRIHLIEARTHDVSSTLIRARLASGQSIQALVPAAVVRHILLHHLYGAADHPHGQDHEHTKNAQVP